MTRSKLQRRKLLLTGQILAAMGISASSLLTMTACTNEVIVEAGDGGSSTTTNTGTSTATSTTTTTVTTTTVPPLECSKPPEGWLEYACIAKTGTSCPSPAAAADELYDLLSHECPSTDPYCGCWEYVADVPCGPDLSVTDSCCYIAHMMVDEYYCMGRPFSVHGEARVASAVARDDWPDAVHPDVGDLDEDTRAALASAWEQDALYEHASIASFARFVMDLLAVGAPPALVRDAQRAMADEIRHAELCFGMASAYRGTPVGPGPLQVEDGLGGRNDLATIAVAAAIEGCVNETVGAYLASAMAARATDPAVRATLERIAEVVERSPRRDETLATLVAHAAAASATDPAAVGALEEIATDESRHSALAWRFVAWACRQDDGVRRAVAKAFDDASAGGDGQADPDGVNLCKMRDHGQLGAAERHRVIAGGFGEVVLPAVRTLMASLQSQRAAQPSV